jgi:hypothetical protein
MPWYTNHILTCKVLNRIASRYEHSSLQELNLILDYATEMIWMKLEEYYEGCQMQKGITTLTLCKAAPATDRLNELTYHN